jgi:TPR repeat protein
MYELGKGVAKDEAKAGKWYQKTAAQGNVEAQAKFSSHPN